MKSCIGWVSKLAGCLGSGFLIQERLISSPFVTFSPSEKKSFVGNCSDLAPVDDRMFQDCRWGFSLQHLYGFAFIPDLDTDFKTSFFLDYEQLEHHLEVLVLPLKRNLRSREHLILVETFLEIVRCQIAKKMFLSRYKVQSLRSTSHLSTQNEWTFFLHRSLAEKRIRSFKTDYTVYNSVYSLYTHSPHLSSEIFSTAVY